MSARPTGRETMSPLIPQATNYHRWLVGLLAPWLHGQLLEVGFGYGQYTSTLARRAQRVVAVDCAPECIAQAPRLPANVTLAVADLTSADFAEQVGVARFDAVVCLNVLEHIEDDVAALRQLRSTLGREGRLLLFVPAHPALYGQMDALAGHVRRYHREALLAALARAELQAVQARYVNALGGLGWWCNAVFFRPRALSAPLVGRQLLCFDRYIQPLTRLIDPFLSRLFGQSLFVVARATPEVPRGGQVGRGREALCP